MRIIISLVEEEKQQQEDDLTSLPRKLLARSKRNFLIKIHIKCVHLAEHKRRVDG